MPPGVRDAVHVACVTAHSRHMLRAGESIEFCRGQPPRAFPETVRPCERAARHGIVDPFAEPVIQAGQMVLILLEPAVVSQVRHDFQIDLPRWPAPSLSTLAVPPADEEDGEETPVWEKIETGDAEPEPDPCGFCNS